MPPCRDVLKAVEDEDLPELRSHAADIRRDPDAVINRPALEHNCGAAEGNVIRVKLLKRDRELIPSCL